jgi:hypothetical protein
VAGRAVTNNFTLLLAFLDGFGDSISHCSQALLQMLYMEELADVALSNKSTWMSLSKGTWPRCQFPISNFN